MTMKKLLNGLLIGALSFSFISTASAASHKEEPQKKELYLLCGVLTGALEHMNKDGGAPDRFIEQKMKNLPADRVKTVEKKFNEMYSPDGMAIALFVIHWYLNNEISDALQKMPSLSNREAEDIRRNWIATLKQGDDLFSKVNDDNVAYINTFEFIRQEGLMLQQKGVDLKQCGNFFDLYH